MKCELAYPTVNTGLPIITESRKSPKLLWLDIGLVNFAAGNQREVFGAKDILDVWRGHLAEQLVGQELLTLSDSYGTVRAFWVRNARGSEAEVDFVCNIQSTLIPSLSPARLQFHAGGTGVIFRVALNPKDYRSIAFGISFKYSSDALFQVQ